VTRWHREEARGCEYYTEQQQQQHINNIKWSGTGNEGGIDDGTKGEDGKGQ
jgi:hypothetical protein